MAQDSGTKTQPKRRTKSRTKNRHMAYQTLMAVLTVFLILSAAVTLVLLLRPLYDLGIRILKLPEKTGISYEVCQRNYRALIDYNLLFGPKTLVLPDFPVSKNGLVHFAEVKQMLTVIQIACWTLLPLVTALSFLSKRWKAYDWMKAAAFAVIILSAMVLAALLIDGNRTLILFHKIFFRKNEYWIFDPETDPVIQILPPEIFVMAGIAILVLMLIGVVILLVVRSVWMKQRTRRRYKRKTSSTGSSKTGTGNSKSGNRSAAGSNTKSNTRSNTKSSTKSSTGRKK